MKWKYETKIQGELLKKDKEELRTRIILPI